VPFSIPTLKRVKALVRETLVSALADGGPILRVSVESVFGDAIGGLQYLFLERLRILWTQLWPDTAKERWLDRIASIWGIYRKEPGPSAGRVGLTGVEGTVVPAGTVIESSGGFQYVTSDEVTILGGEASVEVTSETSGAETNQDVGVELSVAAEIAGLDAAAVVKLGELGEQGIIGGVDIESDEDLRARLLLRIREPGSGGSEADYVQWALEVSGVTRAWAFSNTDGPGTVLVLAANDSADPITIGSSKIDEIYQALKSPGTGKAPAADVVTVGTVQVTTIDLTVILEPNTSAVRSAVKKNLKALFRLWSLDTKTVHISKITGAINTAEGEEWHVHDMVDNLELGTYHLPELGTVTFEDAP